MTIDQMLARQQAIVDAARAAHRDMTAEENEEFNDLQRQIEALRAQSAQGTQDSGSEDPEAIRAAAVAAERQRTAEINALCRDFGIDGSEFISGGQTIEQVRAAVLEKLKKTGAPAGVGVVRDEGDKFREAAADALRIRGGLDIKPADGARELAGMSLRDLAIECMSREGKSAGELLRMNSDALYTEMCRGFYNPTAAFPAILDNSIKKTVVEEYNKIGTTFQSWTTKGTLPDFKTTSDKEYVLGGIGDFELVPENGELKNSGVKSDVLPQRKLDTYGKQFSMTRQAFINDDIDFITKVPGMYAAAAKKTIDKQVYTMLYNNGAIYDGKTIFNSDHKNLITGSGSKPTQTAIQDAILQMQKQTDQFGDPIYMIPKYLIVPMGYEFDLAVIFQSAQVVGSSNNDINPLYNYPLTVVQSPVLNTLAGSGACPWFLVSDPYSAKFIQVDYLNGNEAPTVRRMENPGVLGFVWDIYLDWGITVRDFRGAVKNPGAALT